MALGYTVKRRFSVGDLTARIVDVTLDNAYAANGYSLSPQQAGFGLNGTIIAVIPMGAAGGFLPEWDPVGLKLKVRDSSGAAGTATPEVANNLAGLNGIVARVLVLGQGQG